MRLLAALGFWFGIVWAAGCIYGYERRLLGTVALR